MVSSAKLVNKMKDYVENYQMSCFITVTDDDELQSLLSTAEIRCFSDHQITLDIRACTLKLSTHKVFPDVIL